MITYIQDSKTLNVKFDKNCDQFILKTTWCNLHNECKNILGIFNGFSEIIFSEKKLMTS